MLMLFWLLYSAVDSWRSASTDCPLNWLQGSQRCCFMQRGSDICRLSSQITLCNKHLQELMTPAGRSGRCSSAWIPFPPDNMRSHTRIEWDYQPPSDTCLRRYKFASCISSHLGRGKRNSHVLLFIFKYDVTTLTEHVQHKRESQVLKCSFHSYTLKILQKRWPWVIRVTDGAKYIPCVCGFFF